MKVKFRCGTIRKMFLESGGKEREFNIKAQCKNILIWELQHNGLHSIYDQLRPF